MSLLKERTPTATRTLEVEVTAADLAGCDPLSAFANPVALALRRLTLHPWYVDRVTTAPYRDCKDGTYERAAGLRAVPTPIRASHFLADLNPATVRLLKPFSFVLTLPLPAAKAAG